MARTVKEYDERLRELLNAAQELFFTIGYDATTVNAIVKKVDVAKGTFYHYFESKEDLLKQWVDRRSQETIPLFRAIAEDCTLSALDKINRIFAQSREWKKQNMPIVIAVMRVMYRDNNIRLRSEMLNQSVPLMNDILSGVIQQGLDEGTFSTRFPNEVPSLIARIGAMFAEDMSRIILQHDTENDVPVDRAVQIGTMWEDTVARILGAPSGSLTFIDREFISSFFGANREAERRQQQTEDNQ